jgi:hypothetical protein
MSPDFKSLIKVSTGGGVAVRRVRKGLVIGMVAALAGCAALPPVVKLGSLALSGMSYIVTGKGPSDHVISAVAEQDCALLRVIRGQPVCIAPTPEADRPLVAARPTEGTTARTNKVAASRLPASTAPSVYLVLGSFSKPDNAAAWQETLYPLSTRLVPERQGSGGTTYRVVTGPVPAATSRNRQAELRRIGLDPWRLTLCPQTLQRPPCANTMVAGR